MSDRSSSHVRNDVKQTPEFSSTALEIQNSPPLTSSLHSRHSASSAQESAYLRQASYLRWARLASSVLLMGVGAAIVGCEGHALHSYNMTALEGSFFLPLWPANTDLRPTTGTIAAGAVIILSSLMYFLVALIPSVSISKLFLSILPLTPSQPRSRILYLNILFLLTTILGLAAATFATAYSTMLTKNDAGTRDTIHTWTCKWYRGANSFNADALSLQMPLYKNINAPSGFGRICHETMVGFGFSYAGLGLEVIALGVAAAGLWLESRISKVRKSRTVDDDEKWVNRPGA